MELDQLKLLFSLNVVFVVLLTVPYVYSSPGSGTRIVTVLALIPTGIMLITTVVLSYVEAGKLDMNL